MKKPKKSQCPKPCGAFMDPMILYCGPKQMQGRHGCDTADPPRGKGREHWHRICRKCGYEWSEKP